MMSGQCVATCCRSITWRRTTRVRTAHQDSLSAQTHAEPGDFGRPRIAPELHAKIAKALLSEDGKRATEKLRATYAGKDFVPASRAEYSGLSELLKTSLYYR